jgi:hypothetical protein
VRIFMRGNENNIKMYIEAYENLGWNYLAQDWSISPWGKLMLAFVSTVIVSFGPRGTHDRIFLSYDYAQGRVRWWGLSYK